MDENIIIHKLLDVFNYKSEYQLRTLSIQLQDMYVLERIYFSERIAIKDISKKYNIPPSTLTGIIDRLERKELVERLRANSDRRTIELITTEKGKTIVEKHVDEDKIFSINFFNALEQEKKEKLKELLEELLGNIRVDSLFNPEDIT